MKCDELEEEEEEEEEHHVEPNTEKELEWLCYGRNRRCKMQKKEMLCVGLCKHG